MILILSHGDCPMLIKMRVSIPAACAVDAARPEDEGEGDEEEDGDKGDDPSLLGEEVEGRGAVPLG